MNAALELRPRNILDLMDATIRLYRRNFTSLLGISAVLLVPFGVAVVIGGYYYYIGLQPMLGQFPDSAPQFDRAPFFIGVAVLGFSLLIMSILGPLSQGALTLGISEHYLGEPITVGGAYRRVMKYWWPLFLAGVMFGLLVSIGPLGGALLGAGIGLLVSLITTAPPPLLIAGGALVGTFVGLPLSLLFFTWFVFYEQTIVLEDLQGLESLQRSRQLVSSYGWHVFGTLMLTLVGIAVATTILTAPISLTTFVVTLIRPDLLASLNLLSQCVHQVISVLLGPVFMIVQTLLYYDLRIRKEGFDLHHMVEALQANVEGAGG
ncbi:MAG: DUF7847 domain-containing protein [Candidatus Zipacnadales bacterium]